jgi:hypothetical protein
MVENCVTSAAKYGVVIMPAAVRVSLSVLRYMGHIVRRDVRLSEKATPQTSPHSDLMRALDGSGIGSARHAG